MARKLILEIVADASQVRKGLDRARSSLQRFSRETDRAGRGAVMGSGAFKALHTQVAYASTAFLGGAGLVAGIKSSVEAASDLNEAVTKNNAVFGSNARAVKAWSTTTANALGLSQRAALETASSFGALFKPLGIAGEQSADLSKRLVTLGADLASFYNTDVQDALDAIRSGIVGESEPLRRYGAMLSETRVQQEALAETGKKHVKALTAQEKALARINLIFKDTTVAQGDAAKTGGGFANQMRHLQANVENLQSQLGAVLLPDILRVVKATNQWLSKSKNQQTVLNTVREAAGALRDVVAALKDAFKLLNAVTGSTKGTLKALFAVFVGFKVLKYASALKAIATNIGLIGTQAAKATPKVEGFVAAEGGGGKGGGKGKGGGFGGPLLLAAGETLARFGGLGASAGQVTGAPTPADIVKKVGVPVKGAPGVYRIGDRWYRPKGGGVEQLSLDEVLELIRKPKPAKRLKPATPIVSDVTSGGYGGGIPTNVQQVKRTAAQLNDWFDAMIGRKLDRASDLPLQQQLAALNKVGDLITQRLKKTKDITRRRNLEDQIYQIAQQRKALREQLQDQFLAGLQFNVDKAGLTAGLADDVAAWNQVIGYLDRRIKAETDTGKRLDLEQQRLAALQGKAQAVADQRQRARDALANAARARAQRMQTRLDWAEFALERAQTTKGLKDDIKALKLIIALIEQQIRTTGRTIDRARALWDYRRQLREALHGPAAHRGRARRPDEIPASPLVPPTMYPGMRGGSPTSGPAPPSSGFGAGATYHIQTLVVHADNPAQLEQQLQKRSQQRPQTRRGPV